MPVRRLCALPLLALLAWACGSEGKSPSGRGFDDPQNASNDVAGAVDASSTTPQPSFGNSDADASSGTSCTPGTSRSCNAAADACVGTQVCVSDGRGELVGGFWGPCECPDAGIVELNIDVKSDCVRVSCPAEAPNVVGCALDFQGNDPRGCVARTDKPSEIFLKEGDECGAGRVVGKVYCSSKPGASLDAQSCPINKKQPLYPSSPDDCPD